MKLTVDTNVLLSALIADSVTRTLIRSVDDTLVAPEMLLHELDRHRGLVREKSVLTETELADIVGRLLDQVELVPADELDAHRETAANALADVDRDDVIFLATALAVDGAIWCDDRDFLEQDLVPVVTTEDLLDELDRASEE